jgi:hypothetical protein
MEMHQWSKKIVIAMIRESHRKGEKLNSNYIQTCRSLLYQAACRYFGGWKQAIEAAGFSYEKVRITKRQCPVWSREKIIAVILAMRKKGEPINSNHIQVDHPRIYASTIKYFGSWQKAVEASGIDYASVRVYQPGTHWTKGKVLTAIRVRRKRGLTLNQGKIPSRLAHAARKVFGRNGWSKALRRAGIDPRTIDPRIFWTKKRVLGEISRLKVAGVPLNIAFLYAHGHKKLIAGGRKAFGSWRRAILASGLSYARVRKARKNWWTPGRIIYQINRLEKAGFRLNSNGISHAPGRRGFFAAAVRLFGSWGEAVRAAGIDYRKHSKTWSTKAWIRSLGSSEVKYIEGRVTQLTQRRKYDAVEHGRRKSH